MAPPFEELLASTDVTFRQAVVHTVDHHDHAAHTPGGTVTLEGGEQIEYDWLVLALGAKSNFGQVEGVTEHAMPFAVCARGSLHTRRHTALPEMGCPKRGVC